MTDKPTQADKDASIRALRHCEGHGKVGGGPITYAAMFSRLATEAAKDAEIEKLSDAFFKAQQTTLTQQQEIAELVALLREARCTLSLPTPPIDFKKATITGATMWENERKQQITRIEKLEAALRVVAYGAGETRHSLRQRARKELEQDQ